MGCFRQKSADDLRISDWSSDVCSSDLTLKQAELELARQKKMVAQNAVSQADYEAAEAAVSTTRAQHEALAAQIVEAEVAVEIARVNLGHTRITATIPGTVLAIVTPADHTATASKTAPTSTLPGQN